MTAASPRPREYVRAGTVLADRYEILREIGRGGYSVVYASRDHRIGHDVAIKVLVPPPATAEITRQRMRREVQVVRDLSHASIVKVHDFVDDGELSFIVMHLVDGVDLARHVADHGPLSIDGAVRLAAEIAEALCVAHDRGVLHRDVKPQNILIDGDGRALLADFGSARFDDAATLTRTGTIVGTAGYLPPNVLAGGRADARDDVYALGRTLCFALTGALPSQDRFGSLREIRPDVPPWLERVVRQATAEDPLDRFSTARRFASSLRAADEGPGAPSAIVERCVVCGVPEPLGGLVCQFCGGGAGRAADTLIVIRGHEHAVARVPMAVSEVALHRLRMAGREADAVPLRLSWTAIPRATWLLAALVCSAGFGAAAMGALSTYWPTIAVAGALLVSANYALRSTPTSGGAKRVLSDRLHDAMLSTLIALPRGEARSLFCLLTARVRAFADLSPRHVPSAGLSAGVHELYHAACGVARDLDVVDRLLDGGAGNEHISDFRAALEQDRTRLVSRLLHSADQLDGICQSVLTWNDLAVMDDLARDLAREIEAMAEVNQLLSADAVRARSSFRPAAKLFS